MRRLAALLGSYLNAPSEERWDAIHSTCIKGGRTLWQAWAEVDGDAPQSKPHEGRWPRLPDPETLRHAMRMAAGDVDPVKREENGLVRIVTGYDGERVALFELDATHVAQGEHAGREPGWYWETLRGEDGVFGPFGSEAEALEDNAAGPRAQAPGM